MTTIYISGRGFNKTARFLRRGSANIEKSLFRVTKKQAESAARYAASIAPEQTGALIAGIKAEPENKGKGVSYTITSRTPANKGQNPHNKPYHWFLHMGMRGWAMGMRKSGVHNYMDVTYGWLKKSYPDNVKKGIRNSLK